MQLSDYRICSLNAKLKVLTKAERLDLAYIVVESTLLFLEHLGSLHLAVRH